MVLLVRSLQHHRRVLGVLLLPWLRSVLAVHLLQRAQGLPEVQQLLGLHYPQQPLADQAPLVLHSVPEVLPAHLLHYHPEHLENQSLLLVPAVPRFPPLPEILGLQCLRVVLYPRQDQWVLRDLGCLVVLLVRRILLVLVYRRVLVLQGLLLHRCPRAGRLVLGLQRLRDHLEVPEVLDFRLIHQFQAVPWVRLLRPVQQRHGHRRAPVVLADHSHRGFLGHLDFRPVR